MGKISPPGLSIPADAIQQELKMREHFRECVTCHGLLTLEAAEPIIQKAAKWSVLCDAASNDADVMLGTKSPELKDYTHDVDAFFVDYQIWLRPLRRWRMYTGRYIEFLELLYLSPKSRFEEMERRTKRYGFGTN